MNRSVMVMEPLSRASAAFSERFEASKLTQGLNNSKAYKVETVKAEEVKDGEDASTGPKPEVSKKRKGPKAPNPLSVKKKSTNGGEKKENTAGTSTTKRRRKH